MATTTIDNLPAIATANVGAGVLFPIQDPTTEDMAQMTWAQLAAKFQAAQTAGSETQTISGVVLSNAIVSAAAAFSFSLSGSTLSQETFSVPGAAVGDHVIVTVRSTGSDTMEDVAPVAAQAKADAVDVLFLGVDAASYSGTIDILVLRAA